MTEEAFNHILICIYMIANRLVDTLKELIMFRRPLLCFAKMLMFLGVSAIANFIGDTAVFWIGIFASFVIPSFIVKNITEDTQVEEDSDKMIKLSD